MIINNKIILRLLIIWCALGPFHEALAQKIGVVDAVKVLEMAPEAETAIKKLEEEFAPRDRRIVSDQKTLKQKEEELVRDGATMSDAKRRDLEQAIRAQQRDIRRMRDEFKEDFNLRRNEELRKLQKRVQEVIVTYAKQNQFDLILSDGVVYAAPTVDITNNILQVLKKK